MRNALQIGSRVTTATLVAALIAGTAASASAETPALAPGWQALIGCWEPIATARDAAPDSTRAHLVCVVPVDGSSAVDMLTVVNGAVVARERVDASGAKLPLTRDDCSGWQSAEWSASGERVYLRSELTCEGGLTRKSTGVISMPSTTEWVDVQSVGVGERKAVRALRYREARPGMTLPEEVTRALGTRTFATNTARLAAATLVSPADLVDVSRHLDAAAIEVWLVEQELAFSADAKNLVQLADAGVPTSVIDMVVALSYPERFTLAAQAPAERARVSAGGSDDRYVGFGAGGYDPYWDPYYGSRYNRRYYSPFGYSQYGYGYGYASGWYPNRRPVVIIVGPSDPGTTPEAREHGKVVKGRGYTRRSEPDDAPQPARRPASRDRSSGSSGSGEATGSRGSTGSSGSAGSTGSGSSGEGRTAKRRPPPSGAN